MCSRAALSASLTPSFSLLLTAYRVTGTGETLRDSPTVASRFRAVDGAHRKTCASMSRAMVSSLSSFCPAAAPVPLLPLRFLQGNDRYDRGGHSDTEFDISMRYPNGKFSPRALRTFHSVESTRHVKATWFAFQRNWFDGGAAVVGRRRERSLAASKLRRRQSKA